MENKKKVHPSPVTNVIHELLALHSQVSISRLILLRLRCPKKTFRLTRCPHHSRSFTTFAIFAFNQSGIDH